MDSITDIAKTAFENVKSHNWIGLAAVVLIAAVFVAKKTPVVTWVPWLKTTWGGWALAICLSFAGSVGNSLLAGVDYSWEAAWTALYTAFMAAGGWEFIKDHLKDPVVATPVPETPTTPPTPPTT